MPNSYEDVGLISNLSISGYTNLSFANGVLKGDRISDGAVGVDIYNNLRVNSDGSVTGDDVINGTLSTVIGGIKELVDEPADYSEWSISPDGTLKGLYKGHFTLETETFGSINGPSLTVPGYSDVVYSDGKLTGVDTATGLTATLYTNIKLGAGGVFTGDNALTGASDGRGNQLP
jgi:hypothetical protein